MAQDDKPKRRQQIAQAYRLTRERHRWIAWTLLGLFIGVTALVVGVGWLLGHPVYAAFLGVPLGLLAAVFVFGRRAERAAFAQVEGQPGAAAAALGTLRRGWQVKPAVAMTRNQDVVHRVVGRPGIVLVGEGQPNRVRNLLAAERKKHGRAAPDAPVYEIVAGDSEDAVPIRRLSRHVMKLPRNLRPAEVTEVLQRLKALDSLRPQMPLPKGPMPQSAKAARQMMRGR